MRCPNKWKIVILSSQHRGQNFNYSRGNRGYHRGRYRGNNRGYRVRSNYRGNRGNYQTFSPRYQSPQNLNNKFSNTQSDTNYNPTLNPNTQSQNQGQQSSNTQVSFEVFTPDPNYMPYTQQSSITCHKCGYPNHLTPNCTLKDQLHVEEHKILSIRHTKTNRAAQESAF